MQIEQEMRRLNDLDKQNREPFAYEKWVINEWKKKLRCFFGKKGAKDE